MFCLHSLAMVGRPIHSRTADTATVLSISQPAPIHREYEKNISRKLIYILLILKCSVLYTLVSMSDYENKTGIVCQTKDI